MALCARPIFLSRFTTSSPPENSLSLSLLNRLHNQHHYRTTSKFSRWRFLGIEIYYFLILQLTWDFSLQFRIITFHCCLEFIVAKSHYWNKQFSPCLTILWQLILAAYILLIEFKTNILFYTVRDYIQKKNFSVNKSFVLKLSWAKVEYKEMLLLALSGRRREKQIRGPKCRRSQDLWETLY